ncbi:MAG: polyprenyl synthetase family protein [Chitinophagales bacterium]
MKTLHQNFTRPKDWPLEGNIDLNVHDLPHNSSTTEWWYINSHITTITGRNFSVFASFFRKFVSYNEETKKANYAHSITWAIIDKDEKKYYANSLIDQKAPEIGLERLRKGEIVKDERIRKAAIEMLEKGNVPYPDRLFQQKIIVNLDKLHLKFDDNIFIKNNENSYSLVLNDDEHDLSFKMDFTPKKPVTRHGENGVVFGVSAEDMFYYFIPRNDASGSFTIKGEKYEFKNQSAWYDHEFGCHRKEEEQDKSELGISKDVAWNWISSQLTNGCEFTAYDLIDNKTKDGCGSYLIFIDKEGNRTQINNFKLYPKTKEVWTSTRTFNDYPTDWILEAPELDLYIEAEADFPHQEFATVISKPAFWEGSVKVKGSIKGEKIEGPGFVERSGFESSTNLEEFFKIVSRETIKSVKKILPKNPDNEKLTELISKKDQVHYAEYIDNEQYSKALIEPIRSIIDRGGKSWRSYAALACCDIVGGNSQRAIDWLALPELMHVGSLIVDDVEDKSDVRRGGPSCHKMYNEAIAINAGSACYFIGQIVIYQADELEDDKKLRIYNLYFEALRAAHSGQAMDIHGLDYMMDDVVENGKGDLLQNRIIGIHRLKSAAPASYLAQIGVILGKGTEEQIKGLGDYYEALGISFQIIDDTLNLRGFKDGLKTKGEDITAGKITYPVAKAMSKLEKKDRQRLWEIIQAKTSDIALIKGAVDLLDKVNALDDCVEEAQTILNNAWRILDPMVRDSMVKLNLRAFSWYVLDRHY